MSNLNQWIGQGNLTDDPRVMGDEDNVVRFTVAVNNGFGEYKTTTFVDCVGFGKQAAIIGKNFHKGKQILVRGQLIPNQWEDSDGNKRTKLECRIENVNGFFFTGNADKVADKGTVSQASESKETVPAGTGDADKLF